MNGPSSRSEIWHEIDQGEVALLPFCGGKVAVFSQKCPTRESDPNEDAALMVEVASQLGVVAVADGVGGAAAGNRASKCVAGHVVSSCSKREMGRGEVARGLRAEILDAIEAANREILDWGIGAEATLIAVECSDGVIRSYHAGDSGAILVSNRGNVKFATVGHAPVAQAVEIGLIHEDDGLVHADRNLISNCLGASEMKIEIGPPVRMATRDTLLLASDGLLDNMTQQEIATIICKGDLAGQVFEVAKLAIERMSTESDGLIPSKPDDLTVVAFRLR